MSAEERDAATDASIYQQRKSPPEWMREVAPAPVRSVTPAPERSSRERGPRRALAFIAIALVAAVAAVAVDRLLVRGEPAPGPQTTAPVPARAEEPVTAVAEALSRSVVQIERDGGLGSGVVFRRNGLVLTAAHVVEGTSEVTVRLANGRRFDGVVVGADDRTDVAVIRVRGGELPAAKLAVGKPVEVGQLAVAIGSPFGLEGSVTSGVVSAIERAITINGGSATMIQTDAPINPGNSGGALADRSGRVIGINDAIRTTTGQNAGIGFAIPIDIAATVAKALLNGKEPRIGFIGVVGTEPARGPAGALVTQVKPDTPADEGGLRGGDVITELDGTPVDGMGALASRIRLTRPGTTVTLTVVRRGREIELDVKVGRL